MGVVRDLLGQRFGRLVVVSGPVIKSRKTRWNCQCDCGGTITTLSGSLIRGRTKSCGCLRRENTGAMFRTHGHWGSRTHAIWKTMRQRINNPDNKDYKHYGGRGIQICERWNDYENFLADLGECPPGYSIERIDVDGNYCPENCCWIPHSDQPKNQRNRRPK